MLGRTLLCLASLHFHTVWTQGECTDFRGRVIFNGLHYVPGPDTCTLCVCDNGIPKVCKAVLCSPPLDCRSFRVGNTCCEFICLDDAVKSGDAAEANVRMAAGGAAVLVLLTIALVVYRVRKHKHRHAPHGDDQRSLTSIGYISGSMGYMSGTCETALAAWKPHDNYLPRGEAPPPYDEVVAQCRQEAVSRLGQMGPDTPYHRTYAVTVEAFTRPEDALQCSGHAYVNMSRPVQQMPNPQNCYNAPLLQPVPPAELRDPNPMSHHAVVTNVVGFPNAIRLTGSLGTINSRGLSVVPREPDHERPHNIPGFYTQVNTSLHRTIPRIATAMDTRALEACFSRERALAGEVRRSFHRDRAAVVPPAAGRSVPRNLDAIAAMSRLAGGRSRAHSEEQNVGAEPPTPRTDSSKEPAPPPPTPPTARSLTPPIPPPHSTLPLTVDKPSCECSYDGTDAPGNEDADDYRSECENCKSASSSRWVLEEGWASEAADGTQTLQRRAPPAPPAPPSAATLPQPAARSRPPLEPPSNWENWFNTIPDSDTDSEE